MSFASAVRANQLALATMQPHLGEVLVLLRDVRGDVASSITEMVEEYGVDVKYSLYKHRELMGQLDDAIYAAERQLPLVVADKLKSGTRKMATQSLHNLQAMIDEGAKKFGLVSSSLRLPLAKTLNDLEESLAARHEKSVARYGGEVGRKIRHDMAVGAIKGETIGQTAKRLIKSSLVGDVGEGIAQKQFFKNKADAERLIITEQSHAYNQAQVRALGDLDKDDPGWKKMWDATIDRRTCKACRAMHREVRPWNELFSCGLMAPPLHPYCRCVIVPIRVEWRLI